MIAIDPFLVLIAVLLVLAVWYWLLVPLGEMSGLTAADVADNADLPMWAVVVGGWGLVAMVLWCGWLLLEWGLA